MNTPTTPTPDLESLRKAVQEFQPNPHRVPFNGLKPVHDSIVELRKRKLCPMPPLLNCCNNMASRPAGRVWPNTAASSWKAAKSANGGNGRKPRQPQISRPRLKVRQPWPQNPRRPRAPATASQAMFTAAKRKFCIHVARTAHCQRENDESRRKGRTRRFPESKRRPKIVTAAHAFRARLSRPANCRFDSLVFQPMTVTLPA